MPSKYLDAMSSYLRSRSRPRLFRSYLVIKISSNLPILCIPASRSALVACEPRAWVLASQQCRTFQLVPKEYDSHKREQCPPLEANPHPNRKEFPDGGFRKINAQSTDVDCIYRKKPTMTCAEDLAAWRDEMKYFANVNTALSDTDIKDPSWGFVVREIANIPTYHRADGLANKRGNTLDLPLCCGL